jgi:hypothetical protein
MSSKIVKINRHKLKAQRVVIKINSIVRSIERLESIKRN